MGQFCCVYNKRPAYSIRRPFVCTFSVYLTLPLNAIARNGATIPIKTVAIVIITTTCITFFCLLLFVIGSYRLRV